MIIFSFFGGIMVGSLLGGLLAWQKWGRRGIINSQQRQKFENKIKLIKFLKTHQRITNDQVEELIGVSDATATRYLTELETEGVIRQAGGQTGRAVYYQLK